MSAGVFPPSAGSIGCVTKILTLAELPIIFWLMIRGARAQRASVN